MQYAPKISTGDVNGRSASVTRNFARIWRRCQIYTARMVFEAWD